MDFLRVCLRLSAVALLGLSAACADLQWHRPGVDQEALARDFEECRQIARVRAAREAWPFSLLTRRVAAFDRDGMPVVAHPPPHYTERFVLEQDYTRECMREKGYELVPADKP